MTVSCVSCMSNMKPVKMVERPEQRATSPEFTVLSYQCPHCFYLVKVYLTNDEAVVEQVAG